MQKNFVEGGGASSVLAIADSAAVPLERTQKELTPLQRMVISLGTQKMHEEAQQQSGSSRNPGVKNSFAGSNSGLSGETVEYVNESVNNGE